MSKYGCGLDDAVQVMIELESRKKGTDNGEVFTKIKQDLIRRGEWKINVEKTPLKREK